jgi:hypothetical protein
MPVDTVYQASVVYMRLNREANSSNYLEVLKTLQQALRVLDVRWKAAGTLCSLRPWLETDTYNCSRGLPSSLRSMGSNVYLLSLF